MCVQTSVAEDELEWLGALLDDRDLNGHGGL